APAGDLRHSAIGGTHPVALSASSASFALDSPGEAMRVAVTADLHWGLSRSGDRATRALVERAGELRPDLFRIAGDVGEGEEFARCLALFAGLECPQLVIPGNHDLWTRDPGASSLVIYERRLPARAREHGFHYLDEQPYLAPDGREAVVG